MRILFDSRSAFHKTPFGCLKTNERCRFTVLIPESCKTLRAFLLFDADDGFSMSVPMQKEQSEQKEACDSGYEQFTAETALYREGLYFYHFRIETEGSSFELFKSGTSDTNIGEGQLWQVSCLPEDAHAPEEFFGTVYYQIFPDRFYKEAILPAPGKLTPYTLHENETDVPDFLPDEHGKILNNDFFGGNLAGIRAKLPYLASLGITAIYLNPICKAFSNHRYDTADYKTVDPLLGTEEDFSALCESAHGLGIRILLDGVFSHTGSDSIYFDKNGRFGGGAYSDPASRYRSWYQFDGDAYTSWWGIDTLPCVNELAPSYLSYIIDGEDSVIAHYLSLGADGFRLDVADELPDEFIARLTRRVHELKPGALVLGEVWEDASNKESYGVRRKYFVGGELDATMNYPFRDAILSLVTETIHADEFSDRIMTIVENYPSDVLHCAMNSLSTHDTPRILTLLSGAAFPEDKAARAAFRLSPEERERALSRMRTAIFLQFVLPGSPAIYYGDEAGMEGLEDPFNRAFFPWGREDNDLTAFYRTLIRFKRSLRPLRSGSTEVSSVSGGIRIRRETDGDAVSAILALTGDVPLPDTGILFSGSYENGVLSKGGYALIKEEL